MPRTRLKIATLNDEDLEKLKTLEEATGTLILALEPQHPMAKLTNQQVAKLQALEKELGVLLLAYEPLE
jgi:hypothetical protein